MYSSLEDGLYWAHECDGLVETLVTDAEIDRFQHEPPDNTRAWTRAMLLRLAGPEQVESVDWDSITFSLTSKNYWPRRRTISLANPLRFGKAACAKVFETSATLDEALDLLGAPSTDPSAGNLLARLALLKRPGHDAGGFPMQLRRTHRSWAESQLRSNQTKMKEITMNQRERTNHDAPLPPPPTQPAAHPIN